MKLTFVELPLFATLVTQITDDHFLNQLQNDLLKDPGKGDIIFFYIYTKAKSDSLTPDQEKRLRTAVETIKREFRHENQRH